MKQKALYVAAGFVFGVLLSFFQSTTQPEVKTRIETQWKTKIVEKEIIKWKTRDVVKYRDRVVTKFITKPDGTKIVTKTETTIKEKIKNEQRSEVSDKSKSNERSFQYNVSKPQPTRFELGLSTRFSSLSAPDNFEFSAYRFQNNFGVGIHVGFDFRGFESIGVGFKWRF